MRRTGSLLLALSSACTPWAQIDGDGYRLLSRSLNTSPDGRVEVKVPVEDGETALLAMVHADGQALTHINRWVAPDGVVLFEAEEEAKSPLSQTNAGYLSLGGALGWPSHEGHRSLTKGKWRLEVGRADEEGTYQRGEVVLDLLLRRGAGRGRLVVVVWYAGAVDTQEGVVEATEAAVEHWRELYRPFGLELDVSYDRWPEGELFPPGFGSAQEYLGLSSTLSEGGVNVVLVPSIAGVESVYGIAGNIPGPAVTNPAAAVLVSAEYAAGRDARFSEEELRIFGETLAHETGHLLGLFHPVETTFDLWDALEDTEDCGSESRCTQALAANLMFPYPVCGFFSCTPQPELTDQQVALIGRAAVLR